MHSRCGDSLGRGRQLPERVARGHFRSLASRSSASRNRHRQGSGSAALATADKRRALETSRRFAPRRTKAHWSSCVHHFGRDRGRGDALAGVGRREPAHVDPVRSKGRHILAIGSPEVQVQGDVGVDRREPLEGAAIFRYPPPRRAPASRSRETRPRISRAGRAQPRVE